MLAVVGRISVTASDVFGSTMAISSVNGSVMLTDVAPAAYSALACAADAANCVRAVALKAYVFAATIGLALVSVYSYAGSPSLYTVTVMGTPVISTGARTR